MFVFYVLKVKRWPALPTCVSWTLPVFPTDELPFCWFWEQLSSGKLGIFLTLCLDEDIQTDMQRWHAFMSPAILSPTPMPNVNICCKYRFDFCILKNIFLQIRHFLNRDTDCMRFVFTDWTKNPWPKKPVKKITLLIHLCYTFNLSLTHELTF